MPSRSTAIAARLTLVFNGEIYNHFSLRPDLSGVPWRGHSDSETLVEALARHGLEVLASLQGMYAFAAYDHQHHKLWLARDPLGIKPLYLARRDGIVRFASEQRALGWPTPPGPQQIAELLAWGHLSTPVDVAAERAFGPLSLPPGAVLQLQAEQNGVMTLQRWDPFHPDSAGPDVETRQNDSPPARQAFFRPKATPAGLIARKAITTAGSRERNHCRLSSRSPRRQQTPGSELQSPAQRLRIAIEHIVADHLLADVPVACFLSSGLDSGILTALACRIAPLGSIRSFTVAFPNQDIDESDYASRMAHHCGSEHHTLTLCEAQTISWVEDGLKALDVPSADGLNTYLISRAVADQGIRVALSGLGADELFGGYPSHRLVPWLEILRVLPGPLRQGLLARLVPRLAHKLADVNDWSAWQLTLAMRRWASDRDLRLAGLPSLSWPIQPSALPRRRWDAISCAELFGYTEPMLLRDSDVMSMACSLEVRVPFLDLRLQQLVRRLPNSSLRPGKRLLRKTCVDLFPPGYLDRRKRGFSLPMTHWMRGPLRPLCQQRLDVLQASGWLEPHWLKRQWQRFEAGQLNWPRAWILVVLGEFAGRHVAEPTSSAHQRSSQP